LNKLDASSAAVQKVAEKVAQKVVEAAPAAFVATPPTALVEKAIEVAGTTATATAGAAASGGVLDSLPLIAGVLITAAAVVLGGGDKTEDAPAGAGAAAASPSTSTSLPSADADAVDISIPYDVAAMLAYDKAGKPGDFDAYKVKYYADAVADVKVKRKQKA
jgi:hypothetical protein